MQHIWVRGVATEEYVIPATPAAAPASTAAGAGAGGVHWTAVVLPGNPGSAHYYVPFAHAIHKQIGSRYDVRVLSLAGHSLPPSADAHLSAAPATGSSTATMTVAAACASLQRVYLLSDQIAHVNAYLDALSAQIVAAHPGVQPRFVLFGHSIGSYIGLNALVARSARCDDVAQLVCLFPFLRFDLSRLQNALFRLLFLIRPLALLFIRFVGFLPVPLRRALVRVFTDIKAEFAVAATTRVFLAPAFVRNGLSLGENEFDLVPRTFDASLYRAFAHRLTFYYTELHDHWAPVAQYHQLRALLHDTPARFALVANGVKHAFVVYPEQYSHMALRCGERFLQVVGDAQPASTPSASPAGAVAVTIAPVASPTQHKSAL